MDFNSAVLHLLHKKTFHKRKRENDSSVKYTRIEINSFQLIDESFSINAEDKCKSNCKLKIIKKSIYKVSARGFSVIKGN